MSESLVTNFHSHGAFGEHPPRIDRRVSVFATITGAEPDVLTGKVGCLILDAPGLSEAVPVGTTLNIAEADVGPWSLVEHYVTIDAPTHVTTEVRAGVVSIFVQLHARLDRVYSAAGLDKFFPCDDGKPVYVA